jgi:hypothetical protein
MAEERPITEASPPAVTLAVSDEEVVLHVRGFAVLRATYEAEGYYDETADGDPEEQDLYRIEVLDAPRASRAAEAVEGAAVWPLADLGLVEPTVRRLFPAARWAPDRDELEIVRRYLMTLAHALQDADSATARERILQSSAQWAPSVIEDRYEAVPREWRQALHDEPSPEGEG